MSGFQDATVLLIFIESRTHPLVWAGCNHNTSCQCQAFSKIYVMKHFIFIWLVLFFHICKMWFYSIFWRYCCISSLTLITRCARSELAASTLRLFLLLRRCLLLCQMCQCNKVLYTVEFSAFSVIWLILGWTLGEASSAVVHLNSRHKGLHCIRQAEERAESFRRQYSVNLVDSDLQEAEGESDQSEFLLSCVYLSA